MHTQEAMMAEDNEVRGRINAVKEKFEVALKNDQDLSKSMIQVLLLTYTCVFVCIHTQMQIGLMLGIFVIS